jgi:TonB family protein
VRTIFKAPPVKPPPVKAIVLPAPPVEIPPTPEIARVEPPKIEIPARPVIRQEIFSPANVSPVSPDVPAKLVRTGGFGDPNGVPASAATRNSLLQKVGSFDLASGSATGKSSTASRQVVASAGFGGIENPASASPRGAVHGAGFGDYEPARAAPPAARTAPPLETPVEITYKARPIYTPEAREKKIEGEVQLEVVFAATGRIRVLRLIRGLGFGLDENARTAAAQIRFHPGTRNGAPVDITGTVHIVFEIS